jgi:hypothetical protein
MIPPTGRSFDIRAVDLYEFAIASPADWVIVYDLADFSQQIGLFG